ncbi:cyclin-B1-5-like [Triticum dicoccoides]|uniref:cyclin-B1-5-like n=1 Tax=Triticum dicoccoides TaxID=85692 RepID=UPI001891563A|nr:cyclin-B1-5-like [Triticum dicoccoides]XP_037468019.1 cyclin-B1-5-like [Triticum dicoccoides]
MHPGSEESNVAAPPCFVQEPKQQAPQPAANRGVAVPAGTLKAAAAGVGRPGAVGNMHVLGDIGNVLHGTSPAGINRPIIRRFSAQLLKKAQADPSKNGTELILNSSSSADSPEAPSLINKALHDLPFN